MDPENKYDKIKVKAIEVANKIIKKHLKIYVDHIVCFDYSWGRCPEGLNMIIYDKFLIDYGDWDLVETLIVHECCHLKFKGHGKNFKNLFKIFKEGPWNIQNHPLYSKLKNKLISLKFLNKNGFWNRNTCPKYPINKEVKNFLESKKDGIKFPY